MNDFLRASFIIGIMTGFIPQIIIILVLGAILFTYENRKEVFRYDNVLLALILIVEVTEAIHHW